MFFQLGDRGFVELTYQVWYPLLIIYTNQLPFHTLTARTRHRSQPLCVLSHPLYCNTHINLTY